MSENESKIIATSFLSKDSYWALNKNLCKIIGLEAALVLSDLISKSEYFEKNNGLNSFGFFYNTTENISNDTTLSRYSIESSIKLLKSEGLIDVSLMGMPAKNHYKVNFYAITAKIIQFAENKQTCSLKISKHVSAKSATNNNKEKEQSNKSFKVSKDTLGLFDSIDSNNTDITNITINNKESEKNFSEKNEFEERQKKCRKDMIHFFCKEYWPTYKFFAGRDGKAINEIIEQSKKHLDYHGADSSPDSIFEFFKVVIQNLPDFFKYKNLAQINSSYSGILKQIQDGRNKNYRETELERNQRRTEEILAKLREQRS
jgi:hypothetical protein